MVDKGTLRRALRNWEKAEVLGNSSLVNLAIVSSKIIALPVEVSDRGQKLRTVLREAIDLLDTTGSEKYGVMRTKQFISILQEQFIQQRTTNYVADFLGIAESTYFRLQNDAVQALAEVIEAMNSAVIVQPKTLNPTSEASPKATASVHVPILRCERLFGRESLLQTIEQILINENHGNRPSQLVALYGLPGAGKSAIACEIAYSRRVQAHFPNGVLWLNISREPDLSELIFQIAIFSGIQSEQISKSRTISEKMMLLRNALIGRHFLVILDDLWSDKVFNLRSALPGCAFVVTTRKPSIAVDFAGVRNSFRVSELDEDIGFDLLKSLAPFAVESNPVDAKMLVKEVGSLPLLVRLYGRYLAKESHSMQTRRVQQALRSLRLAEFRKRLISQPLEDPYIDDATSTIAIFDWSLATLERRARIALFAVSLLPAKPNTFSEDSFLEISGADIEVLDELIDSGLVEAQLADRYTLHQAISDHMRSQVFDNQDDIWLRIASHYLDKTIASEGQFETAESEYSNIIFALEVGKAHGLNHQYVAAAHVLLPFFETRGLNDQAFITLTNCEQICRHELEVGEIVWAKACLAKTLYLRGRIEFRVGNRNNALDYMQESLELFEKEGNSAPIVLVLEGLGELSKLESKHDLALDYFQRALSLAQSTNQEIYVPKLLLFINELQSRVMIEYTDDNQANSKTKQDHDIATTNFFDLWIRGTTAYFVEGKPDIGKAYFLKSLEMAQVDANPIEITMAYAMLGLLQVSISDYTNAETACLTGIAASKDIPFHRGTSICYTSLSFVHLYRGNFERSISIANEGLTLARQADMLDCAAELIVALSRAQMYSGDLLGARSTSQEALLLAQKLNIIEVNGFCFALCSQIASREGKFDEAAMFINQVSSVTRFEEQPWQVLAIHEVTGENLLRQERFDEALPVFLALRDVAGKVNGRASIASADFGLAQVAEAKSDLTEAYKRAKSSLKEFDAIGHEQANKVRDWLLRLPQNIG